MLITFILLDKYLEAAAKGRTSAAVSKLLEAAAAADGAAAPRPLQRHDIDGDARDAGKRSVVERCDHGRRQIGAKVEAHTHVYRKHKSAWWTPRRNGPVPQTRSGPVLVVGVTV